MKAITLSTLAGVCLWLAGCGSLRFAPSERQKQTAWLHNRTATITAETARAEDASEKLRALAGLSELQSSSFISYYGPPKKLPKAVSAEDVLAESNWQLAGTALAESANRPDAWRLADNVFKLAIGISALLGGVYGTRAARFLREVRAKSKALKEVVQGNELFKKGHKPYAGAFKEAHKNQSPQTRQIVAEMKV